jgi:hypothetical protein
MAFLRLALSDLMGVFFLFLLKVFLSFCTITTVYMLIPELVVVSTRIRVNTCPANRTKYHIFVFLITLGALMIFLTSVLGTILLLTCLAVKWQEVSALAGIV